MEAKEVLRLLKRIRADILEANYANAISKLNGLIKFVESSDK